MNAPWNTAKRKQTPRAATGNAKHRGKRGRIDITEISQEASNAQHEHNITGNIIYLKKGSSS